MTKPIAGDDSILDNKEVPAPFPFDGTKGLSAETRASIKSRVFDELRRYRDQRLPLPPLPDAETLQKMMSVDVGEAVSAEYVPMMIEEMLFDDGRVQAKAPAAEDKADIDPSFSTIIIGAGMSGVCAAI